MNEISNGNGLHAGTKEAKGQLFGVGVGPGDPELLTLKALKVIQQADVIAYFARKGKSGHARAIVGPHLSGFHHEEPLIYPVTTEIDTHDVRYGEAMRAFYARSETCLRTHLDAGRTVAVLSEGDPLFFGSYMHLHVRLVGSYDTCVVPGIMAMSASWAALKRPFCQGRDIVTVLPGTLDDDALTACLAGSNAVALMKVGRHLPRLRRLLDALGLLERAHYIEYCGQAAEQHVPLADIPDDMLAPYLSLILIPGARAFDSKHKGHT